MHRRSTRFALLAATLATLLFAAAPAFAITLPEKDTVHTNVGLVRFTTADGRFRCSGTLIAPKVVLTAGHCTEGPATNVYVSFDTDLALDPLAEGISAEEKAAREAHYIKGTAHPDPDWDGRLNFPTQHDMGVVVLDARASTKWPGITPAPLPPVGYLDGNQGQLKNDTFTLVGYGVEIGDKKERVVVPYRHSTTSYLEERRRRGHHVPDQRERLQGRRWIVLRQFGWRCLPGWLRPG